MTKKPDGKTEVKTETKPAADKVEVLSGPPPATATPATTTTAMTETAPKAVATKPAKAPVLTFGQRMAARDPGELEAERAEKLDALRALATDADMPEAMRKSISLIVDQAAQVRPGMEEVATRWKLPRLQIAQASTTTAAKPEDAKNGDMYTTAGKRLEKPFGLIPIYFNHENIMFPTGARAPTCQAPDAKLGSPYGVCQSCPHLPFGMQNNGKGDQKKTDCQNQIVVIALAKDLSQVYMIQFSKTSRGAGSALQNLAGQQPFPWKQSYLLDTEKGQADLGNFFKFKVAPTGIDNDEHVQKFAAALCNLYSAERNIFMGEWYRGASSAPAVAAAAEGEFQGSKLDAGLNGGESESYDLGDAGTTPSASTVRTAAKPM